VPFYRALTERCPSVDWQFVGCPRELQEPLRHACDGRATFFDAGWQQRELLSTWDALVYHHPTLTESFGRTVAEAMIAGCIPIVDRRGGFCEQLASGGGFLRGTIDEFATALDTLRDADARQGMSHRARSIAEERWSLRAFGKRLRTWIAIARTARRAGGHKSPR